MLDPHFVILGFFIGVAADFFYSVQTIRGKTRPNRVSWMLWATAPLIAFAAELSKGVGLRSLMTFGVGFGPFMVVIASFLTRKATWKLGLFDYSCGLFSLLALILWGVTREGNVAIALSIAGDAAASLPTIVKSYKDPGSESWVVFGMGALNAIITLLTIKHWTFANWGFPLYICAICLLLTGLIRFKSRAHLEAPPATPV